MHQLAGKRPPRDILVNVPRLVSAYYTGKPDCEEISQQVSFGTSGHRGSSETCTFNEDHVLAICQALCSVRAENGIVGPLFLGMDTHALSEPARSTALEVFAANDTWVVIPQDLDYTPTPVISHAILCHNRAASLKMADGVVITPSHNPPNDGGFKYNPPAGGPADSQTTQLIQDRANKLLKDGLKGVKRLQLAQAMSAATTERRDLITPYVNDLNTIIDMDIIRSSGITIGVDPMGGAAIKYWEPIASTYGIALEVVNEIIDPAFAFMMVDSDGKIRMDCSSPSAMASLIDLKDRFSIAFGNDPDVDRHGIVAPSCGLINPNHFIAVAIRYLLQNRPGWSTEVAVGKTLVSSSVIDRVAADLDRRLCEVPVGFKWFVPGLTDGSLAFAGEESAGATFLRKDGTVWSTDKDGIIMDLLAAEITAKTGNDPGENFKDLERQFGSTFYDRIDAPASRAQQQILKNLTASQIKTDSLAGEKILTKLTHAPGNGAAIGGLKVVTQNGWFAARPSGTEEIYKIYAESFINQSHLHLIQTEAQSIIGSAFADIGS